MIDQTSLASLMESAEAGRARFAALCFLVWDICITTDDEVTHIWQTPFQPLKLLYILTRYYSVIALIVLNTGALTCQGWVILEAISAVLLEAAVEIMLILRIYAMYTANRNVLRFTIPPFLAQIVIMIVGLSISLPRITAAPTCITADFPTPIIAYSISSIVFEALLFGLAVYKYWTEETAGLGRISLLQILFRDSLWTFLLIFVANFANTLFFTLAPATLAALGFPWLLAVFGAVGPRLVLNVRRLHARNTSHRSMDSITLPLIAYTAVVTSDPDFPTTRSSTSSLMSHLTISPRLSSMWPMQHS